MPAQTPLHCHARMHLLTSAVLRDVLRTPNCMRLPLGAVQVTCWDVFQTQLHLLLIAERF